MSGPVQVGGASLGAWTTWRRAVTPPPGTVSWPGLLLFMLLVAHPLVLTTGAPDGLAVSPRTTQDMVLLIQDVAILSAGILLKLEHAANAHPSGWWFSVVIMTFALQRLPISLLAVAGYAHARGARGDVISAALVAVVCVALLAAARWAPHSPPVNGLGVALVLGGGLAWVRLARAGELEAEHVHGSTWALVGITAGCAVVALVLIAGLHVLPVWFRAWLLACTTLMVASTVVNRIHGASPAPLWSVACGVVASALLLAAAVAILRSAFRTTLTRLLVLTHRAALAEAAVRAGRAQVHEVTATVAGIASAARLLTRADERTGQRRRLAALLDSEMARLDRMLTHPRSADPAPLSLRQVLEPLVGLQTDLGRSVTWFGPDVAVHAGADQVTEIVVGLLSNADRHAPGAPVEIVTGVVGQRAEVRVSDAGPGVDRRVGGELFEWGARGPHSCGQGIGLQVAREVARRLGGDLEHVETGRGATFVLSLPLAPPADRAPAPARPHLAPAVVSLE